MRQALAISALFVLLAGCQPPKEAAEQPLILKSYDVPSAHAPELVSVIRSLMYRGREQATRGNASLSPGGQILVAAPAGFHPGVAELVRNIAARPPSPPPSVALSYWLVIGQPAATGERTGLPAVIAPALDSIEKNAGSMRFELLESLSLTSVSGEHANVGGSHANVQQKATAFSGTVLAGVEIRLQTTKLDTTLQIPLNKTVVLGQSGYTAPGKQPGTGGATIFYVIQASIDAG